VVKIPAKQSDSRHGKNGFVTATKLGTTNKFFVATTKNFAAATKRFVDRTKHFVVATKYLFIRILTNDFVGITKPFIPWSYLYINAMLWIPTTLCNLSMLRVPVPKSDWNISRLPLKWS